MSSVGSFDRVLRAAGLAAVALVLMAAMVLLGLWQLGVYRNYQAADAEARLHQRPVPLASVLGPDQAFPAAGVGLPVRAAGHYLAAEQAYARGLPGAPKRYAVVTPLLTNTGSAILVVRGAATGAGHPPPDGRVVVRGVLEPATPRGTALDANRVATGLKTGVLVNGFRPDLYDGYLIARTGPSTARLSPVPPPVETTSSWAGIRNLLYALQWWVFAGFVAYMWWRIVRDSDPSDAAHSMAEPAPSPMDGTAVGPQADDAGSKAKSNAR